MKLPVKRSFVVSIVQKGPASRDSHWLEVSYLISRWNPPSISCSDYSAAESRSDSPTSVVRLCFTIDLSC